MEKLFTYLCLHSGGIIAHNTVASALGVSTLTVTNHLELLVQANLIYKLPPVEIGGKMILRARNKYYVDAGGIDLTPGAPEGRRTPTKRLVVSEPGIPGVSCFRRPVAYRRRPGGRSLLG